jgi:hypothetical protein
MFCKGEELLASLPIPKLETQPLLGNCLINIFAVTPPPNLEVFSFIRNRRTRHTVVTENHTELTI